MTEPPAAPEAPVNQADEGDDWQRLNFRTVYARLLGALGSLLPILLAILIFGGELNQSVLIAVAAIAATGLFTAGRDLIRTVTTRYRLGSERIEVRSGLLVKKTESAARDRIRSVDVTAKPLHRIFSVTVVKIGTGRQATGAATSGEVVLDAVSLPQAEFLHRELLRRPGREAEVGATAAAADENSDAPAATETPGDDREASLVATLNPSWLWLDMLSIWILVLPGLAVGTLYGVANTLGLDPGDATFVTDFFSSLTLIAAVAVVLLGLLVVGAVTGLLIYIETWGNLRVTRQLSGSLRIRRGLLTSRSILLEGERIRGAQLLAPLLLRTANGARPYVLTTGVTDNVELVTESSRALAPSLPLAEAERIVAEVLGESDSPVAARHLTPHPSAAGRRRFGRAGLITGAVAVIAVATTALVGDLPVWVPIAATVAAAAVAFPLALIGYRGLGHGLTPGYLVVREGAIRRRTVALQRSGVIGIKIRTTVFQRRLGLASMHATTAATGGDYRAHDVAAGEAVSLAEQVAPSLLAPFIVGD